MITIIIILAVLNFEITIGSDFKNNEDCTLCGMPTEQEYKIIVNGTSVEDPGHTYPWMVAIYRRNVVLCSGFIVSKEYIMTGAHCLTKGSNSSSGLLEPSSLVVEVGYKEGGGGPEQVKVDSFSLHPDFVLGGGHFEHDIALLRLGEGLRCGGRAYPVCLPHAGEDISTGGEQQLTVAGFGHSRNEERKERIEESKLTVGQVKQVDSNICKKAGPNTGPDDSILCGVSVETKQVTCEGDSGGPAFALVGDAYFALGVTSALSGGGPCVPDAKSTFSRIAYYSDWIKGHLGHFPEPQKSRK